MSTCIPAEYGLSASHIYRQRVRLPEYLIFIPPVTRPNRRHCIC